MYTSNSSISSGRSTTKTPTTRRSLRLINPRSNINVIPIITTSVIHIIPTIKPLLIFNYFRYHKVHSLLHIHSRFSRCTEPSNKVVFVAKFIQLSIRYLSFFWIFFNQIPLSIYLVYVSEEITRIRMHSE